MIPLRASDRVAVLDGSGAPNALLPALIEGLEASPGAEVLFGWSLDPAWDPDLIPASMSALMGGPVLAHALADGSVAYIPHRMSQFSKLFGGPLRSDVLLVQVRPCPGGYALAGTASWGPAAARSARMVVAEVNVGAAPLEAPVLPAAEVRALVETDRPLLDLAPTIPTPVEEAVAGHVLPLIPFPCTVQYGPGGVPGAVLRRLAGQAVTLRSGAINDAALPLLASSHVGRPEATTVIGPSGVYAEAAAASVTLVGVERSHDIASLAGTPRFVAVNTAISVDLSGAVNVERVGDLVIGAVGGHADFALAGTLSDGGLSIIALPSQRRGQPTILPRLDVPTTTPRVDVDVIVTEHGVADLRGLDERLRAQAIARVASPEDQDALWKTIPDYR